MLKNFNNPSEKRALISAWRFDGDLNLLCGKCGEILVEGIMEGEQIMNVVIRCPVCRSYNEIKITTIESSKSKRT